MPSTLTYAEARGRVLAAVRPLPPERIPVGEARGRALRQNIVAAHPLPPFRNSSMDGVAVCSADLADATDSTPAFITVVEVLPAGRTTSRALAGGEAIRIMTGAMIPDGADAVVPVEDLETLPGSPERVRIRRPAPPGQNFREAGRDLAAGDPVLGEGRELSAHDLGLLASLGEAHVLVGRPPVVAAFSTGDELLDAGAPLVPGAIRDGNLPMLAALLEECGARVARAARLPDDPVKVTEALGRALSSADVVLTIGGVSAGDFDPVKQSIGELESVELWRVAMKPGRPQAFGTPSGRLFFGLPGNPASVACVFEAFVRPALRKLQGFAQLERPHVAVQVAEAIPSRAGRTDLVRVTLARRDQRWWAAPAGDQVSGHLTPQSRAHALLIVPEERESLAVGDGADAILLRWPETGER
ncbi:MAG TPA: gephyrin-like molybdotransferase Glp [Candidatus Limnocylindria bacterium]|nr:gephyrin-like molybdotransferase Glp [Candidatus Limnocylindria bacterium]